MKQENNNLEQFENIGNIEPSDEWNEKLMQRLNRPQSTGRSPSGKLLILAVIVLVTINIFSFSKKWLHDKDELNSSNLKNIASEFLIYSNSSKY